MTVSRHQAITIDKVRSLPETNCLPLHPWLRVNVSAVRFSRRRCFRSDDEQTRRIETIVCVRPIAGMRADGALRRRRSRGMIPERATEANRLASESALKHDFEVERAAGEPAFKVDLDGFEGPLDLLLELARRQKVDLARISILDLANQYLAFVEAARKLRLELAADYLVMAAWLAYLKSRLLLPAPPKAEAGDAADLAEKLAERLRRLEVIRRAADLLMKRPQLGRDVFARGAPESIDVPSGAVYSATLYDLISAYA